jgi:hypothetical protein
MSRVYLLRISQRLDTFRLYDQFKRKSMENRKKIRLILCITRRQKTCIVKGLWEVILKHIPNSRVESFGQLIDLPPENLTTEEFISLFHKTLMDECILKRNPLLYTTEDYEIALREGQMADYGRSRYLIYPSLYVFSHAFSQQPFNFKNTNETVVSVNTRNHIFLGLIQKHSVNADSPLPQIDDFHINGAPVTQMIRIPMNTDYHGTHKPVYLLYFPEIGPLLCDTLSFQSKKNCVVSFNIAFCACSASMKVFFKNKRYKTKK